MIQIRNGAFETNSSSTHSICISKNPVNADGRHIDFCLDDFGWEFDVADCADYFYTAIMCTSENDDDVKQKIDKLKNILDKHGISYMFEKPVFKKFSKYTLLENGSIDHSEELVDFVDVLLNNEDMLLRFLFGSGSAVYTGNDNADIENERCSVADTFAWKEDENGHIVRYDAGWNDNPYFDPDNFEYFYKSN